MAEENKTHIKNESNVAPFDGAGALDVSYKNKMMRSVLFIDTHSENGQGSGSIVKQPFVPSMLLTCNHVIPSKDVARECSIYFDYYNHEKPGVNVLGKDLFNLDGEDGGFITDEALDYTIITMMPNKIPGEAHEPFFLHQYQRMDEYRLKKNDSVYLVHYPRMDGSFVRRENAYTVQFLNGYLFGHKAETQGGSSGCPVLKECRNEWVLVGVHRGTKSDKSGHPRINLATHVEAVHHTMNGMPNPLGDPNWEEIRKENSNLGPGTGKKERAVQQDLVHTELEGSKPDMGDNQPGGAVQVTKPTSTIPDVLKGEIRKHKKYQKILRNKVARHPEHLKTLSNNLGVKSGRFIAKNPNNMEDAAAELLIHWAEGNAGKTPIWSDLLEAMRESEMTTEADELEEYLR